MYSLFFYVIENLMYSCMLKLVKTGFYSLIFFKNLCLKDIKLMRSSRIKYLLLSHYVYINYVLVQLICS